jgi:hypothetical protein
VVPAVYNPSIETTEYKRDEKVNVEDVEKSARIIPVCNHY